MCSFVSDRVKIGRRPECNTVACGEGLGANPLGSMPCALVREGADAADVVMPKAALDGCKVR
jgi:hypothetical protein